MQAVDSRYTILPELSLSEQEVTLTTISSEENFVIPQIEYEPVIGREKISAEIKHRKFLRISEPSPTRFPKIFSCSKEIQKTKTLNIINIPIERNTSLRQPILMKRLFKSLAIENLNNKDIKLAFRYINIAFKIIKKFEEPSYSEDELLMKIRIEYSKKYPKSTINLYISGYVQDFLEKYRTIKNDPSKLDFMVKIVEYSLKLSAKDTILLNELGFLRMRQEKFSKAIEAFKKTLKLDKHDMIALRFCASICLKQRNASEAMKYITTALEWSAQDKATLQLRSEVMKLIDAEKPLKTKAA